MLGVGPMSHVFHRHARHDYPVAVAGDGVYLIDREGRRYLDASGGAAVSCLGHSDRAVSDAIAGQLAKLPYAHTSFFSNEPMEALATRLIATAPAALDKVYFTSGGAEAMEAALKWRLKPTRLNRAPIFDFAPIVVDFPKR